MRFIAVSFAIILSAAFFVASIYASEKEFKIEQDYELNEGAYSATVIHGYGELHYNRPNKDGSDTKMDMHRMVIGVGHSFNDNISLHVEVDYEHAAKEMELEFAYLDFTVNTALNFRAGVMLMPVGYLNEYHEPPLFYSVERPYVQKYMIPTTWQEGGAGIFGTMSGLKYKLYLVSGLNAAGFSEKNGLRSGRGKVSEQKSEDMALVTRIEYAGFPGLTPGISLYKGDASQGDGTLGEAGVTIFEADLSCNFSGIELKGLFIQIDIDDASTLSTALSETIAEKMTGFYIEGAFRFSRLINFSDGTDLVLMARYEDFDTQDTVPSGFTKNTGGDRQVLTFAVAYYPVYNVALKADYEDWEDGTDSSWNQLNLAVAYMF